MLREPKFFGESLPYLKPFSLKGKLIVIEGTGHIPMVGKPEEFNQLVQKFLTSPPQ